MICFFTHWWIQWYVSVRGVRAWMCMCKIIRKNVTHKDDNLHLTWSESDDAYAYTIRPTIVVCTTRITATYTKCFIRSHLIWFAFWIVLHRWFNTIYKLLRVCVCLCVRILFYFIFFLFHHSSFISRIAFPYVLFYVLYITFIHIAFKKMIYEASFYSL